MKIAIVSEHADPLATIGGDDAGGQNVYVAALAAGLAACGHEVVVHTRRDSTEAAHRVRTDEEYVVERVAAGPPEKIPKDRLLPYMDDFGAVLREQWLRDPVDVVHAHYWMSGVAALAATRGTDIPVVQTFHALGSVKRREQGAADTSHPGRIRHERHLCRSVDHVLATCSDEVAELRALGMPAERASVVPCGVDTQRFRPLGRLRRASRPTLLVVGRLVERKGVATVLEALAEIPDTELVVVGGPRPDALEADPEVSELRRLAEKFSVDDRVRFTGGLAHAELPELYAACEVVVTVPWYEPFGIVPVEAMACGRPVVGSAVGGLLDSVQPERTGLLVPPRDPGALARALHGLLADPARCAMYGRAGRQRAVDTYDWRSVVAQVETVYEEVVRRREGSGVVSAGARR